MVIKFLNKFTNFGQQESVASLSQPLATSGSDVDVRKKGPDNVDIFGIFKSILNVFF